MIPDPELVERVARALRDRYDYGYIEYWREVASAAIVATLADPAIAAGLEASASLLGGRQLAYGINTARLYSLVDGDKPTPLGHRLLEIVK
jgi:hypothetical protein